jgi:hypothetical protein
MTVIGALSSFRELGEMSPHKRASVHKQDYSLAVGKPETGPLPLSQVRCDIRIRARLYEACMRADALVDSEATRIQP